MIIYYSMLAVMIAATVFNLWSARQYRHKLTETNDDYRRALAFVFGNETIKTLG